MTLSVTYSWSAETRSRGPEVTGRVHDGAMTRLLDEHAHVWWSGRVVVSYDGSFETSREDRSSLVQADVGHVDLEGRVGRPWVELHEGTDHVRREEVAGDVAGLDELRLNSEAEVVDDPVSGSAFGVAVLDDEALDLERRARRASADR